MNCIDCGCMLERRNKSGRCRACFNLAIATDPLLRARQKAGIRRFRDDPANAPRISAWCRAGANTRMSDPDYAARLRKRIAEEVQPKSVASPLAREMQRKAAFASAEKRIAWCPPEYRDEYRRLSKNGVKKAEAQRMIRAQVAADKARALAKLSPFERQERALQRGAGLAANDAAPSPYAAEKKWSVG